MQAVGLSNKGLVASPIPPLSQSQAPRLTVQSFPASSGTLSSPSIPSVTAGWEQGRSLAWQEVSYGLGAKLAFCTLSF